MPPAMCASSASLISNPCFDVSGVRFAFSILLSFVVMASSPDWVCQRSRCLPLHQEYARRLQDGIKERKNFKTSHRGLAEFLLRDQGRIQCCHQRFAGTCCEMESVFPSGSLNHATWSPLAAVHTPNSSCFMNARLYC